MTNRPPLHRVQPEDFGIPEQGRNCPACHEATMTALIRFLAAGLVLLAVLFAAALVVALEARL